MILTFGDYRSLVRGIDVFAQRRLSAQSMRRESGSFRGDPTRAKLESLVRRYHRGLSASETLRTAESSFASWLETARMATRAERAIEMLGFYLSNDPTQPSGPVIELFKRTELPAGRHTVRVQRDVFLFGVDGHILRVLSTVRDDVDDSQLPQMLAPLVLATERDAGENRLASLSYWRLRDERIIDIDISATLAASVSIAATLDAAEVHLGAFGWSDEGA